MLILSRNKNQSIVINGNIFVTIVEVNGNKVRLGIDAPKEVSVHRSEIHERINQGNSTSPAPDPAPVAELSKQISEEAGKHIHYLYREMRERRCPACGHNSHQPFEIKGGLMCPICSFAISEDQIRAIKHLTNWVFRSRLASFKDCGSHLQRLGEALSHEDSSPV
jgi:carbon storage regulator